ncbi:hypothetical protein JCM3765_000206 [Sporobolomyces pararoseus]
MSHHGFQSHPDTVVLTDFAELREIVRQIVGKFKPQWTSWANIPQEFHKWWTDTLDFIDTELPRVGLFCFVRRQQHLYHFSKALLDDLTNKFEGLRDEAGQRAQFPSLGSLVDVALFGIGLAIAAQQPLRSDDREIVFENRLAYVQAVGLPEVTLFVRQMLAGRWLSLDVREQSRCMDELYTCQRQGWTTPASFLEALKANCNFVEGLPQMLPEPFLPALGKTVRDMLQYQNLEALLEKHLPPPASSRQHVRVDNSTGINHSHHVWRSLRHQAIYRST